MSIDTLFLNAAGNIWNRGAIGNNAIWNHGAIWNHSAIWNHGAPAVVLPPTAAGALRLQFD